MSANRKTGYIPVSTSERATCPDSCVLKNNGCYHDFHVLGNMWNRIDKGLAGSTWDEFCEKIKGLPRKQLWRHNVGGDLPGWSDQVDTQALSQLVEANKGKQGFTFTHKPVGLNGHPLVNAQAIFASNKNGFTINLSADNLKQADELYSLKIGPVVTILPHDIEAKSFKTPNNNTVVICPATRVKSITCATCGMCAVSNRKSIVGFPAHGARKKAVTKLAVLNK